MSECKMCAAISRDCNATALERNEQRDLAALRQVLLDSAIEKLREIAHLMGSKTARRKVKEAGRDLAANWLYTHGYALWEGGYIPGAGFEDGAEAARRREGK
jgi:hypothetical protein